MAQSPNSPTILRGQIYFAELKLKNPKYPDEPLRDGFVVVASINELNAVPGPVIIFPISKSVYAGNPNQVPLRPDGKNNLSRLSAIVPLHVRGVAKERLKRQTGWVTKAQVDEAVEILNVAIVA